MKIVSYIPIKLNNERLPGKNTKKLCNGRPLISYILETISKIDLINEKFAFCSTEEIKPYLRDGIKFLKRDKDLDGSNITFNNIFDSFLSLVNADIYILIHATAPFLKVETIECCINKVLSEGYDSAFTAIELQGFLWQNGVPCYNLKNIPRTQDIHPTYMETTGIYVFKKDVYINERRRIGNNPYIHVVSNKEAVDIDNADDFELANAWIKLEGENMENE